MGKTYDVREIAKGEEPTSAGMLAGLVNRAIERPGAEDFRVVAFVVTREHLELRVSHPLDKERIDADLKLLHDMLCVRKLGEVV
jgi:hypothetical protein